MDNSLPGRFRIIPNLIITMSEQTNFSEPFGNVPNPSESFRTIPNAAEGFGTLPKVSERKENHTLTVREVARMFESAGVARTERSIINWCQPNKLGIPRLDAYFDPNERRYFISSQSVGLAIKEEQAKAAKLVGDSGPGSSVPKTSESPANRPTTGDQNVDFENPASLNQELMDLKITNRAKDYFIEQLKNEREGFALERKEYVEKLINSNRQIGELETRLLQLNAPRADVHSHAVSPEDK